MCKSMLWSKETQDLLSLMIVEDFVRLWASPPHPHTTSQ